MQRSSFTAGEACGGQCVRADETPGRRHRRVQNKFQDLRARPLDPNRLADPRPTLLDIHVAELIQSLQVRQHGVVVGLIWLASLCSIARSVRRLCRGAGKALGLSRPAVTHPALLSLQPSASPAGRTSRGIHTVNRGVRCRVNPSGAYDSACGRCGTCACRCKPAIADSPTLPFGEVPGSAVLRCPDGNSCSRDPAGRFRFATFRSIKFMTDVQARVPHAFRSGPATWRGRARSCGWRLRTLRRDRVGPPVRVLSEKACSAQPQALAPTRGR